MRNEKLMFLIFLWVGCEQADSFSAEDKAEVVQEAKQMLGAYFEDIKKDGLSAEFKYLDSSSDFFWVPPGYNRALNYDSVKAEINRNALVYVRVENSFDTLTIFPLTICLASYHARITSKMTDTAGITQLYSLIESGILVKRNTSWKLLSGQTAMVLPQ